MLFPGISEKNRVKSKKRKEFSPENNSFSASLRWKECHCCLFKINKASATVEAAMIMPIIIAFFLSILWLIQIFQIHSIIGALVDEAGCKAVTMSYVSKMEDENIESAVNLAGGFFLSEIYLRTKISESEVSKYIDMLSFLFGVTGDKDTISLKATYVVRPPVKIPGYPGMLITNTFYSKAYVGYEISDEAVSYIYVTRESQVYHTSKECRALTTYISTIFESELETKRNRNGGKYYPCEKCADRGGYLAYITPYGTKYHKSAECSGLTTRIMKIPMTEVGERRKCFYCD